MRWKNAAADRKLAGLSVTDSGIISRWAFYVSRSLSPFGALELSREPGGMVIHSRLSLFGNVVAAAMLTNFRRAISPHRYFSCYSIALCD